MPPITPIGQPAHALDTPALCLDAAALERNIAGMAAFLADGPVRVRPHTKTHKCPTIAWMQLRAGAIGVTCAKLGEAEVMAAAGIDDILIANQIVGPTKTARLAGLALQAKLMVAVDSEANAREISAAMQARGATLRVLVEVDVGMGRCGVAPGEPALALARAVAGLEGLTLAGLMGYEGHAVGIRERQERQRAAREAMARLVQTRHLLESHGLEVGIVSAGGTGTYDITGRYEGVTEIQAGSYATMDATYAAVGVPFAPALTLLARVISTPRPGVAVIDAGLKATSNDFGPPTVLAPEGWALTRLSEEHGLLENRGGPDLHLGDTVTLWPSHGCTTINLHDAYHVLRDGRLQALWPIAGRGQVR